MKIFRIVMLSVALYVAIGSIVSYKFVRTDYMQKLVKTTPAPALCLGVVFFGGVIAWPLMCLVDGFEYLGSKLLKE